MTPHGQDAGPSAEAKAAGHEAIQEEFADRGLGDASLIAHEVLAAAHDPSLGDARSVNEAWCRADQTRRIVEWLRDRAIGDDDLTGMLRGTANCIAREFGAQP
jgi:hypothetical protein